MLNWLKAHSKALLIGGGAVVVVLFVLWQRCGISGCPDVDQLKGYMPDEASLVVDHDGKEIGKLFLTRRVVVPLDSLPEHVPQAFIAMEDRRFYEHNGVDWWRVIGAAWRNVKTMDIQEGSSTITMQLARNLFPEKLPAHKKTIWRKIGEARVARAIEKEYSKEEIIELYVNQIYFGEGAWGIEAASQEYFGKPAAKLTLAEAAILAAVPRAPSRLNPRTNREAALEGRRVVLERMAEQEMISQEQANEAAKARLRLRRGQLRENVAAPYFIEAIRTQLEHELGDAIYSEGYTIHTTLDARLQKVVEEELSRQLRAAESGAFGTFRHVSYATARADTNQTEGTRYLQAAAIFMDARTGDIRALVGGRDFQDSEFNRALHARRQPGSAFKPFVYAAAFEAGYTPTHRLLDTPLRLVIDRRQTWEPKNYDGTYAGVVTVRQALTHSRNVPTIRLAAAIGIDRVVDMARQMGLSGRIPFVPSVVLGSAEVTPIDMTAAFAAFATLGDRPAPRFVTRVVDRNGSVVWSQEPERMRVLDPAVAFMTTSLMQDVVDRGTGTAVRAAGYRDAAAGKTGTTNDAADIWFIGFTPRIVGTIWIGFDKRKTVLRGATGGELAAPVWGRVMARAGESSNAWAPPPGVELRLVDSYGNVLGENCPVTGDLQREYFIEGTAPIASCYPANAAYTWLDSGYSDVYDQYDVEEEDDDDGWWDRMRERLFGNDRSRDVEVQPAPEPRRPQRDTLLGRPWRPTPPPRDTTRPPPDTSQPRQDTLGVR